MARWGDCRGDENAAVSFLDGSRSNALRIQHALDGVCTTTEMQVDVERRLCDDGALARTWILVARSPVFNRVLEPSIDLRIDSVSRTCSSCLFFFPFFRRRSLILTTDSKN